VAFFPLLDGSLDSDTKYSSYSGAIVSGEDGGVSWSNDDDDRDDREEEEDDDDDDVYFPNAMECFTDRRGLVELDAVPYGTKGAFSVNFWLQKKPSIYANDDIGYFEYIFSHTSSAVDPSKNQNMTTAFFPWSPDQIHLFLPTIVQPAHGVLRAVVKDSDDTYQGLESQTFLDTDGRYMDNNPRNTPGHVDLEDQTWHMITLTSGAAAAAPAGEEEATKGYKLYVDGVLAGEAPPSVLTDQMEKEGITEIPGVQIDGGDPILLDAPIHLCGRVDEHPERHFQGKLAHLSLWDDALTPEQVAEMFSAKMGINKLEQRCIDSAQSALQAVDGIELCPFLDLGDRVQNPSSSIGSLQDLLGDLQTTREEAQQQPQQSQGEGTVRIPESVIEQQESCSVLQIPTECAQGSICMPEKMLSGLSSDTNLSSSSDKGKCVAAPVGGIFPPDPSVNVPLPVAFFPLTGGSVESWPLGSYKGRATNVDWVPDVLFENSLKCSEQQGGFVQIPNVKYGSSGSFAVNFWMRKDNEGSEATEDNGFEYIFSHGNKQGDTYNPFGPNNVHVYLPEVAHPAHGVARVIVKDSAAVYNGMMSHTFYDSDGKFMDNNPRNTIGHVNLEDGNWHMFTVTTKSSGEPGFQIYVDGTLGGSFPTAEVESFLSTSVSLQPTQSGLPLFQIDGGQPMQMEGDIFLCGRGDLEAERHFDGQLAHLELFDASLTQEMIGAMYGSVKGQSLLLQSLLDLASSVRALQPNTTDGRPAYYETLRSADIISALTNEGGGEGGQQQVAPQSNSCNIDVEASGIVTPIGCEEEGLVCAALHEDSNNSPDNGICVATPDGGIYAPNPKMNLPVPKAYFPLTGGSLKSWPEPTYGGTAQGVGWVEDGFFGNVLQCEEDKFDYVALDNVEYGASGAFSINVWMAHNSSSGNAFEFLFSHGNDNMPADPWMPNEVQIYVPEIGHPAHGVIRTIVKDENDVYVGAVSETYLDSDGGFMNNMPRNVPGHVPLDDGKWHMITVTSQPDGSKGYSLYVDGILGGTSPPAFVQQLETAISVDGGDPILPSGNMYLCGRNDLNRERHFGGKLAHLSLFDEALTGQQIMSMYIAGAGEATALQRTMSLILSAIPQQQTSDVNDPLRTLTRAQIGEACYLRTDTTQEQFLYSNSLENKMCVDGAICAPKANSPAMATEGTASLEMLQAGLHGQCVEVTGKDILPELQSHDGQMYFPNPLMNVPTPYAFFPLTSGKLSSWPSSLYEGENHGAKWVQDDTFGEVLSCDAEDNAFLTLDPVPYAAEGPFAVNFWFRNNDSSGNSFEYVYSHSGDDDMSFNPFYPNQLHVYIPESSHIAHGVVRTIMKDSEDVYQGASSETFLDSDGFVSNNLARDAPGHIDVNDNEWHMITISSRPDMGKGYIVFVDGVLGGANFLPMNEQEALFGKQYQVDGGKPAILNGHIFLCGRNDLHPERHFKGMLSHLTLFDTSLTPTNVAALFVAVRGEQAFTERLEELVAAQDPKMISEVTPIDRLQGTLDNLQSDEIGSDPAGSEIQRLQSTLDNLQDQSASSVSDFPAYGGSPSQEESSSSDYRNATKAGLLGLFLGLISAAVIAGLVYGAVAIYRKRKAARPGHGEKMLALPTRSPAVSRNPSMGLNNQCISPDHSAVVGSEDATIEVHQNQVYNNGSASGNPLVDQVKSAQIKSQHKKLSQYETMEDEE
jgi:hypothetical protein